MEAFIAIDGGGSKTELVLVDILGNILSRKVVNCSNPNDVGMDDAFSTLNSAIKEMLAETSIEVKKIFLLIAGIEFGDSKKILKERLANSIGIKDIHIDGDLASVKECGLGNRSDGIVIISGTGFNMAIKKDNEFTNVGGWGYLCDDYLSGFDLGKDALVYSSRAINGVGEKTILVDMLEKHFSNSLWYSMKEIYDNGIKGVASLSKLVVEAYKLGDSVAKNIIHTRVERLVNTIKSSNGISEEILPVVLFGGVFENNSFIVEMLKQKLGSNYHVSVSNSKTIYGAVSIGYKSYNLDDKNFYSNFDNSYKECLK